jgi:hypothetical protein
VGRRMSGPQLVVFISGSRGCSLLPVWWGGGDKTRCWGSEASCLGTKWELAAWSGLGDLVGGFVFLVLDSWIVDASIMCRRRRSSPVPVCGVWGRVGRWW